MKILKYITKEKHRNLRRESGGGVLQQKSAKHDNLASYGKLRNSTGEYITTVLKVKQVIMLK